MEIQQLEQIVELHGDQIYGFCCHLAGSRGEGEELYQEAFLKAAEICHKIDVNQNPKAFISSIAAGLYQNKRRKLAWRHRIAPVSDPPEEHSGGMSPSAEEELLREELCKTVRVAAETLPDKLKVPLYMHYTADISVEEIATALKVPEGTVKSRLHRARKRMKEILEGEI